MGRVYMQILWVSFGELLGFGRWVCLISWFSVEIWHLHVCLFSLLGIGIASYPLLHVRM